MKVEWDEIWGLKRHQSGVKIRHATLEFLRHQFDINVQMHWKGSVTSSTYSHLTDLSFQTNWWQYFSLPTTFKLRNYVTFKDILNTTHLS